MPLEVVEMSLNKFKEFQVVSNSVLSLPNHHPFRGKKLYQDENGKQFYESLMPKFIPQAPDDQFIQVSDSEYGRLDLISFRLYQTTRYWWILANANNIVDPFEEILPGKVLRAPSVTQLFSSILFVG